MVIDPLAADGFDHTAEAYERGRPEWPPEAVDRFVAELERPAGTLLDLAAGTGKLTRLLVGRAERVVAVEPLRGMREVLSAAVPRAEVVEGTAEAIPLPDGSADAVVVGEAFHWFDGDAAIRELARVLRPRGTVGLFWNRADWGDAQPEWAREVRELIAPARTVADPRTRYESGLWREPFERTELLGPLEEAHFPNVHRPTPAEYVAQLESFSYVGALPEGERRELLCRAAALLPAVDRLELPHCTDLYRARRVGPAGITSG